MQMLLCYQYLILLFQVAYTQQTTISQSPTVVLLAQTFHLLVAMLISDVQIAPSHLLSNQSK